MWIGCLDWKLNYWNDHKICAWSQTTWLIPNTTVCSLLWRRLVPVTRVEKNVRNDTVVLCYLFCKHYFNIVLSRSLGLINRSRIIGHDHGYPISGVVHQLLLHWPLFSAAYRTSLVLNKGVGLCQDKPPDCFRRLEKLVLPSIFDTSLSSFMMRNLQNYPTTVEFWMKECDILGVKPYSDPYYIFSWWSGPQLQCWDK